MSFGQLLIPKMQHHGILPIHAAPSKSIKQDKLVLVKDIHPHV